jgi:hypothetical protein
MIRSIFIILCAIVISSCSFAQSPNLKLVFIRHGEKPDDGNNLNCQGLNRSLALPAVLYKKFGVPNKLLVPAPGLGKNTKNVRMLQTISPFAAKYNLSINTAFDVDDKKGVAEELLDSKGTIIITWEHNMLPKIVKALGVKGDLDWPDEDYDSIWIVTFKNGKAVLTKDKEGLRPAMGCSF